MRFKIKQARIDLNDVVRHAVELHAFQIADRIMQENKQILHKLFMRNYAV